MAAAVRIETTRRCRRESARLNFLERRLINIDAFVVFRIVRRFDAPRLSANRHGHKSRDGAAMAENDNRLTVLDQTYKFTKPLLNVCDRSFHDHIFDHFQLTVKVRRISAIFVDQFRFVRRRCSCARIPTQYAGDLQRRENASDSRYSSADFGCESQHYCLAFGGDGVANFAGSMRTFGCTSTMRLE